MSPAHMHNAFDCGHMHVDERSCEFSLSEHDFFFSVHGMKEGVGLCSLTWLVCNQY